MHIAATDSRRTRWAKALTIGLLVALLNLAAWHGLHGKVWAPEHHGPLAGMAYNGADRWQSPLEGERPTDASIAQDLALLAPHPPPGQTTDRTERAFMDDKKASNSEKAKALGAALAQIEKQFGKGSVMRLDGAVAEEVQVVSTGSLGLDVALGVGGLPRGRVVEIYGPESSGKTTLTLQVIAEMQKLGGTCAFIDAEHALDTTYAQKLGVNLNDLLISQPDTGEQALEITDALVRSGAVDLVVIDSVAALTPRAEIEGDMGDSLPGLQARLMSQALRKLTGSINRTNTMVIFINQIRMKIGVMFGNPETTTGGNALKFYASVRLDIRRIETIKNSTEAVGSRVRVKVVKNKVAAPFRIAEFDIMYGEGISMAGGLLDVGVAADVISKTGAWFNYGDVRLGQGREQSKEFLKANPEVAAEIDAKLRALSTTLEVPVAVAPEAE
jgi:recombination protein RecA